VPNLRPKATVWKGCGETMENYPSSLVTGIPAQLIHNVAARCDEWAEDRQALRIVRADQKSSVGGYGGFASVAAFALDSVASAPSVQWLHPLRFGGCIAFGSVVAFPSALLLHFHRFACFNGLGSGAVFH